MIIESSTDIRLFYLFPIAYIYIWAFGQLFATIWLFMGKHRIVALLIAISCFCSFTFPDLFFSRLKTEDFTVGERTITIESHRISAPDGGCTYTIYEPVVKGLAAKKQYTFFASLPNLPFSEFVTTEETENGFSIIFNDNSRRLIVSYDYATDEWSETNEETE